MVNKDTNCLIVPFKNAVKELMKQASHIPDIKIVETCRTYQEQKEKVRKGLSKTYNSKHLIGEACDIYVKDYSDTLYDQLYKICQRIDYIIYPYYDLDWKWDRMHFEYDKNKLGKLSYKQRQSLFKLLMQWFTNLKS